MRKIIAATFVSLDGIMQAPGGPKRIRSAASSSAAGPSIILTRSRGGNGTCSPNRSTCCSAAGPTTSSPRIGRTEGCDSGCLQPGDQICGDASARHPRLAEHAMALTRYRRDLAPVEPGRRPDLLIQGSATDQTCSRNGLIDEIS